MSRHASLWLGCLVCALGCSSQGDPVASPEPPAAVQAEPTPAAFQALLERISTWYRANAPQGACRFAPPASAETIAAAEAALGRPLPADVRALYQAANGSQQTSVIGAYHLLSLGELCDESALWEGLVGGAWSRGEGWLPLTANGGGDHDCRDARGRVFAFSHETGREGEGAPTLHAWLEQFVEELEADRWVYSAEDEQIVRRE